MAGRGKHDVVIAAVDGSPADLVVRPADWATDLTGEHAVFFCNLTGSPVTLDFGRNPVLLPAGAETRVDLAASKPGHEGKVVLNAACPPGCYTYSVNVRRATEQVAARGHSSPTIIIDP